MTIDRHRCDDSCLCPVHGAPMWYAAATAMHACQDPSCVHAGGVDLIAYRYEEIRRAEAERAEQRNPRAALWSGAEHA